jgi:hypothetical protein
MEGRRGNRFLQSGLRVISDFLILAAMATRRPPRVRCGVVANVAVAFVLAIAGCDAKGDGPGGVRIDGGGGGASGSISCNTTAGGCLCFVDDAQPGDVNTCSPTSVVANEMERGVCCLTLSLCTCTRYSCRSDPGSSFCQCGSVTTLAGVTLGSPVAECPAPTADQKCCFSQDNDTCVCSRLACAAEETAVSSCSATAAGACNSDEEIDTCR